MFIGYSVDPAIHARKMVSVHRQNSSIFGISIGSICSIGNW
jgi:hypothetical protein